MYAKEFNQLLAKSMPKAVLLYGEDDYLIDYYIMYFTKKLDAGESMLKLYFEEWDFEKAKAYLSQTSLFGGTNLLLIKHDKKIPKKELDTLVELANKNSYNYLIYRFSGSACDAKALQSSFTDKTGGVWVRFFEPNIRDAQAVLQQKAAQLQLDIDPYALQHLMLVLNNNLSLCAKEMEKLSILGTHITGKEIDRLVYSAAPLATEKLLIELFNKKPIAQTIERLLEIGEDEASILRATQYFVNQIFLFHAHIKLHGRVDSAAILGYKLPKPIEDQKAELALRIKSAALLKIYEHLLESEITLKKAPSVQKEALLYGILIRIQGYL